MKLEKTLTESFLNHLIILTMVFSSSTSFYQQSKNIDYATMNFSFPEKNDRLLRPIIVPNLTVSWNSLPSTKEQILINNVSKLKPKNYLKTLSEDSLGSLKNGIKPNDTLIQKFSSRYSSETESQEKNDKNKVIGSGEKHKNKSISSKYKSTNEKVANNPKAPYFISHSTSNRVEEAKPSSEGVNEAKEEEKAVPSMAVSKPQKATSFSNEPQKNYFADEDYEDDEGFFSDDNDEEELEEAEDDVEKKFFHDFDEKSKEYNSVQTPLKDIKYKGDGFGSLYTDFSEDFDYHFDWMKPRKRLLEPMKQNTSGFHWGFTKEPESENKSSKIEKVSKDTIKNSKNVLNNNYEENSVIKANDKLQKIQKPNGYDRNNTSIGRSRGNKKFNMVSNTDKDNDSKKVNRFISYRVTPTGNELESSKKFILHDTKRNPLLMKQKINFIRPNTYNSTLKMKEDSVAKKIHSKIYDPSRKKNFHKEIERQQNNRKPTRQKLPKSHDPNQSFNHLEESDEMYNQILSNIQSVFGIRTEPLKSSLPNKLNSYKSSKLKSEESRSSDKSLRTTGL